MNPFTTPETLILVAERRCSLEGIAARRRLFRAARAPHAGGLPHLLHLPIRHRPVRSPASSCAVA
jgi:hypothetical protein